jgi:hypothetical protein
MGADTFALAGANCGVGGTLSDSAFDSLKGAGDFQCSFLDGPVTPPAIVTVADDDGGSGSDDVVVTVSKVAPTVESLTVPWEEPIDIDDQALFSVDVTFSDPAGKYDERYTCEFDLDYKHQTFDGDFTVEDVTGTSCGTPLS